MINTPDHVETTSALMRPCSRYVTALVQVWLAALLGGVALLSYAANANDEMAAHTYTAQRIVAVGDVHGAYEALQQLLQANQIIDAENRWIAGTTHLVSLGDMLDRGARSREVMDLLRSLQVQAREANGRVHVLLGNHESMNLLGDLRDVSVAEFASYLESAGEEATDTTQPPGYAAHRAAFAPDGDYGQWLLSLPMMIKINDTLFVHGGVPPLRQSTLEELNREAIMQLKAEISSDQAVPVDAPLLDSNGPLWYRGSAACHPILEAPILEAQLAAFGARDVVIGHTPTPTRRVQSRLQGRVTIIDTGMLRSVYRGKAYLVELTSEGTRVFDVKGNASTIDWWHPVLTQPPENETGVAERIRSNDLEATKLMLGAEWTKARSATIAKLVASWRLDRELGLWMTPLTIADETGRRYLQVIRDQWITEAERRASGRTTSNHCLRGHQNLLVAAFDALQGVTTRSVESLYVHKGNGNLRLAPIPQSFGTSTQLPQYGETPTVPDAMARKLAALDNTKLTELLGDLLSKRQIKALLARRDKILQWPRTEHTL